MRAYDVALTEGGASAGMGVPGALFTIRGLARVSLKGLEEAKAYLVICGDGVPFSCSKEGRRSFAVCGCLATGW